MKPRFLLLAFAIGCHNKEQQLTNCRIISKTGDALTTCLVLKYDWVGQLAAQEGNRWQAHEDSIGAQLHAVQIAESLRILDWCG